MRRLAFGDKSKRVTRVARPIVAGFVAGDAGRCLADRVVIAQGLQPALALRDAKAEARQHLAQPVNANPDVVGPGTALQLGSPASLSSLRNVRPLFCVAWRRAAGNGAVRYPLAIIRATRSTGGMSVEIAVDHPDLHRTNLEIPDRRVNRAAKVPSGMYERRVVDDPWLDSPSTRSLSIAAA